MIAGLKVHGDGKCFADVKQAPVAVENLKFYLSFENSYHCNGFISDKFWKFALGQNLVPIVFVPHVDELKAMVPPNSFINAGDFATSKQLVDYVDYLDSNNTAYLEYHHWRTLYPSVNLPDTIQSMGSEQRSFCELCRVVREKRKESKRQFYQSVSAFSIKDL